MSSTVSPKFVLSALRAPPKSIHQFERSRNYRIDKRYQQHCRRNATTVTMPSERKKEKTERKKTATTIFSVPFVTGEREENSKQTERSEFSCLPLTRISSAILNRFFGDPFPLYSLIHPFSSFPSSFAPPRFTRNINICYAKIRASVRPTR